jgi:hypothetical protein
MNTLTRVGSFTAAVSLVFGAAFGVGHVVGPVGSEATPAHNDHAGEKQETTTSSAAVAGGLQVSERGYTLALPESAQPVGKPADFRFQVLGPDGKAWTRYDRSHDKDLHLIVARRDLSEFQHVHPVLGDDGTWSLPLTFEKAGSYRVFADFVPSGDPAGPLTLGADLSVTGDYRPQVLPAPSRTATVDGYTVTLTGDLKADASGLLTLSVARDGRPVTDLQPYLGAYGHLVALRQGDLAYLHVHPQGEPGDGVTRSGPGIAFHAQAPSVGNYRLYLDFRHQGKVRTAEFTVTVANGQPTAPPASTPSASPTSTPTPAEDHPDDGGGHSH